VDAGVMAGSAAAAMPIERHYDVAVIGAGVVGAAVARLLSHHALDVVVLEAGRDVGGGTSKATAGLLHSGFDCETATLEAQLVARGYELLSAYAPAAGVARERTGALIVAWTDEDRYQLDVLASRAAANGCANARVVDAPEVARLEPHLAAGAQAALLVPDEAIIDPFAVVLAFATEAVANGAVLQRDAPVLGVEFNDTRWTLTTPRGDVHASYVVNAGGREAAVIDRLRGLSTPPTDSRRGEFIVFDKLARPLLAHVVRSVTSTTASMVVAPTVFGNVLVGPTDRRSDGDDDLDPVSTRAGIDELLATARRVLPALGDIEVTATYAGVRAVHPSSGISIDGSDQWVSIGATGTKGLSASMAIAERVFDALQRAGLDARTGHVDSRVADIGETADRPYCNAPMITADAEYGRVVCYCERVTRGDLRDARCGPVPAVDLDGIRRRTRALMGRCQGAWCTAEVIDYVARSGNTRARTRPVAYARLLPSDYDVIVVGGGPAGLATATGLRRAGAGRVALVEREPEPGGVTRHVAHTGFGLRDLHRVMHGPAYARTWTGLAEQAGVDLLTETMVTDWRGSAADRMLECTGPGFRVALHADAVVLATGCRERPRAARLIPGSRPGGVLTNSSLQRLASTGHWIGNRAVVVGAEHVSYSAVLTLQRAGVEVAAMVTESARHETYAPLALLARRGWKVPLYTRTRVEEIYGPRRVEGVLLSGHARPLDCDTVVFTGDWVPDSELAEQGGLALAPKTRMPLVDTELRSSVPGVFAVGNLLHAAQPADVCALEGRHAAAAVTAWLATNEWGVPAVDLRVTAPLLSVTPQRIALGDRGAPRGAFLVGSSVFASRAAISVMQGGDVLWRSRRLRLAPGRAVTIDDDWLEHVDPAGGEVTVAVAR
jgi:L-2-hydroxyglutarate oxidase LhgO